MTSKPSGTVTFLSTDIENSTQLAREHPESWEAAKARHNAILREAIESNHGFVFQVIGDAFCAAFHRTGDALNASISAQQDLENEPWGEFTIYVWMGIHTGEADSCRRKISPWLLYTSTSRKIVSAHWQEARRYQATPTDQPCSRIFPASQP